MVFSRRSKGSPAGVGNCVVEGCSSSKKEGRSYCIEHNSQYLAEASAIRRSKRNVLLDKIRLERGCRRCGYAEHTAALEFHHINPATKSFDVASNKNNSLKAFENELAKCEVLCANCHRIIEAERRLTNGN